MLFHFLDFIYDIYTSCGIRTEILENGDVVFYRSMFFGMDDVLEYKYIVDIVSNDSIEKKEDDVNIIFNNSSSSVSDLLEIEHGCLFSEISKVDFIPLSIESENPNLDCVSDEILCFVTSEDYISKFGKYSSFIKVDDTKEVCDYLYSVFRIFEDNISVKLNKMPKGYRLVIEGSAYELLSILKKIQLDNEILNSDTFNFKWIISNNNVSDFAFASYRKTVSNFSQKMLESPFYFFHIGASIL